MINFFPAIVSSGFKEFTQVSGTATRQKVKNLLANTQIINLAFMIYIAEDCNT